MKPLTAKGAYKMRRRAIHRAMRGATSRARHDARRDAIGGNVATRLIR
ncbi:MULTISPECIES: hypothetical protein [unclassified Pseudoalteromonas]